MQSGVHDLTHGPHCFVPTTIVTPWAPPGIYRRLGELAAEANADAESFCTSLVKRDGRERWMQRVNDGSQNWWARRQGAT